MFLFIEVLDLNGVTTSTPTVKEASASSAKTDTTLEIVETRPEETATENFETSRSSVATETTSSTTTTTPQETTEKTTIPTTTIIITTVIPATTAPLPPCNGSKFYLIFLY